MISKKGTGADSRSSLFTQVIALFILLIMLAGTCVAAQQPVTCDPKSGIWGFGLEWIADTCIPNTMTDSTPIQYLNNAVECHNNEVTLFAPYGDDTMAPEDFIAYALGITTSNGRHYKIFRNSEGSHFVLVNPNYIGLIDGKNMNDYAEGQVYTDVFSGGFILPQTPDCQGGSLNDPKDPNDPSDPSNPDNHGSGNANPSNPNDPSNPNNPTDPDNPSPCNDDCSCAPSTERPSGSTVNLGTGRLSHSQQLFSVNTGSPLNFSMSLFYRSKPFAPSSIGNGWSHNYEMLLQTSANVLAIFWYNGKQKLYTLNNGSYISPKGDTSTLVKNDDGTYLLTEKNGFKRYFDTSGLIASVVDRFGNALTFAYSGGVLSGVTDQNGRTAHFTYNNGKLVSIVDPNGATYGLSYTNGTLANVTLPGGDQWNYTYNSTNNLLETKTDPKQQSTTYTYTGNTVTSVSDPTGKSQGFSYAASSSSSSSSGKIPAPYPFAGLPPKQFAYADKNNNSWSLTYDTLTEKVRSVTDPLGNVTSYTYDGQGNMLSFTEPPVNGIRYTTFYAYDTLGNLIAKTEPLDTAALGIDPSTVTDLVNDTRLKPAISYTYDTTNPNPAFINRIKSASDQRDPARILTTSYGYTTDAQGNLAITITDPANATTTLLRDTNGRIKAITDANGKTTSYTYRSDGLLDTITAPFGVTTTYAAYDGNGNGTEIRIKDSDGALRAKITLPYDARYRVKSQTVTTTGQPDIVTGFDYDANSNIISVTDPEQNKTSYDYTYSGQVKKIVDALGKETSLTYGDNACPTCSSSVDKLTIVEDAKHQQTKYDYDKLGRQSTETDPLGRIIKYTYYDNGLLKEKIDASDPQHEKLLFTYSYNNRGQITNKHYTDGSPDKTYTYDANGRIKTTANGAISYTLDYYDNGRQKSVTDNNGRQVSNDSYGNLGQRTQVTIKDGTDQRTINYSYDEANRPKTITTSAGTFTYSYDNLGRRSSTAYPNGITASYSFDSLNRLTGIKHAAGATTIAFANYSSFDKIGNRKSKTTNAGTENYSYDNVYRLLKAITPKGTENYSYDAVGNRLTGPGPKDTKYQYNAGNQMTIGKIFGHDYDSNGNQTSRTTPNASNKGWTYTWDYDNQLIKSEQTNGTEKRTATFKYDPFGRRIEKKLTTVNSGKTTITTWTYVYDGSYIALEILTKADGTTEKTWYTHGAGTDEHLALERSGSSYFYHADGLGSVTTITDASKNVVQSYSYDSFGQVKPSTGFRNAYTYTGREWDKETGLYYYRARYYDPVEGRFISEDPIPLRNRTQDQLNSYSYAVNNPINFTDPNGENIYGNWCGPGGSGPTKDGVDAICKKHDNCFNKSGATWKDNVLGTRDNNKSECIDNCNKELCDDLRSYFPKTYSEIFGKSAVMIFFGCSP